jgi:hypothetical protein
VTATLCLVFIYSVPVVIALATLEALIRSSRKRGAYDWRAYFASLTDLLVRQYLVHHSPNQLTLAAAYRFGWTGRLSGTGMLFVPLVWLGFPPPVVFATLSLNLPVRHLAHRARRAAVPLRSGRAAALEQPGKDRLSRMDRANAGCCLTHRNTRHSYAR